MNPATPRTVAVFTKNRLNPAYHGARLAAERVADRHGARMRHYVPEKPDDVAEQIALIDEAIRARPDAIVLVPVHLTAIDASVRRVNEAGIPIFNCINRLSDPAAYVTFVGADDRRMTPGIARRLFDALGGRGDVAILEGTPGTITGRDRVAGFRDAAASYPDMRIVASRPGNFLTEDARIAMQALIAEFPRLDGVLAANDSMALGAIEALRAAGRSTLVTGVNAVPEAIAALKAGTLLATADFDAFKIAALATEAAVRHLRGEAVPKEILPPVEIVDRSNCARWDRPMEARECPVWEQFAQA